MRAEHPPAYIQFTRRGNTTSTPADKKSAGIFRRAGALDSRCPGLTDSRTVPLNAGLSFIRRAAGATEPETATWTSISMREFGRAASSPKSFTNPGRKTETRQYARKKEAPAVSQRSSFPLVFERSLSSVRSASPHKRRTRFALARRAMLLLRKEQIRPRQKCRRVRHYVLFAAGVSSILKIFDAAFGRTRPVRSHRAQLASSRSARRAASLIDRPWRRRNAAMRSGSVSGGGWGS